MAIISFREPLPEDRLSEKERDKRARILAQFAKKLRIEITTADLDDGVDIRQLLVYVGKRLELIDFENRYGRVLKRFDFLLGRTTKPVPQGVIGVAARAALDLGRKDTESVMRSHQLRTESLIAEISMLAPAINKLLDQRPSLDKENYVLRPGSCLPEGVFIPRDAISHEESAPEPPTGDTTAESVEALSSDTGKLDRVEPAPAGICRKKDRAKSSQQKGSKTRTEGQARVDEWVEMGIRTIKIGRKTYVRNHLADKLTKVEAFTKHQRNAAVLFYGYRTSGKDFGLSDEEHADLIGCHRSTIYGHRMEADSKMDSDLKLDLQLKNRKR